MPNSIEDAQKEPQSQNIVYQWQQDMSKPEELLRCSIWW